MRECFAHLSYMHQGSAVSVAALLVHLSQMHRGPTVGATELFTRVSHMRQVPVVGATEVPTGIPQMHYSSLVGARQRLTSPISLYLLYLHRRYLIGFPGILSERIESLKTHIKIHSEPPSCFVPNTRYFLFRAVGTLFRTSCIFHSEHLSRFHSEHPTTSISYSEHPVS